MAMVMYLFTCGFVCDNSNVYSTCSIHTDSKGITYSNAYTPTAMHTHQNMVLG